MKYALIIFLLTIFMTMGWGQTNILVDNVLISAEKRKTVVSIGEKGELQVNVSPKNLITFKKRGWVRYSDFGARGDGKTDDSAKQNAAGHRQNTCHG